MGDRALKALPIIKKTKDPDGKKGGIEDFKIQSSLEENIEVRDRAP